MLFRLALACGVWDVDAFAAAVPAGLLQRWLAYFEVEPWGGAEDWRRAGEVAAMVANCRAFRPADSPALSAERYVPRPPKPPPTARERAVRLAAGRAGWEAMARAGRVGLVQ